MENNISIKTLSMVHVGSGNELRNKMDFIEEKVEGGSDICVVDPDKIAEYLGEDRYAFDQWVACIEKGDTMRFLSSYLKGMKTSPYTRRVTNFVNKLSDNSTIKEQMNDGQGRPYIPGSSIKGAIRTAVISSLAERLSEEEKERLAKSSLDKFQQKKESLESLFLGAKPNDSIMRFVIVGDAFFDKDSRVAVRQISLNLREKKGLIDDSCSQVVEAIAEAEKSSFLLKIDKERFDFINRRGNGKMPMLPEEISTIPGLFKVINDHTEKLVLSDIEYWEEQSLDEAEEYLKNMKRIKTFVDECKEGECVMRVGQAGGWRFITGAWTERLHGFKDLVVPRARRNNDRYQQYVFPKTRRIDDESCLFGFVKLSLKENSN